MRYDPLQRMFLVYPGGSPAPQQSTTTVNQLYSPEEAARRAKLMAEAEQIYAGTAGVAAGTPPGGPSAETIQAQNMMRSMAGANPLSGMADQLQAAQIFGFNAATNPTAAPGFQDVLNTTTRKVTEAYEGPSGPFAQIRQGYSAGNSGGTGTREGIAMGMAGRDYLNTIGDVTGRLTSDAYRMGLDTFGRTMALAPQNMAAVQSSSMLPANIFGAIGAQNEAYDREKRDWELNAQWQALAPYANVVMGTSTPGTQTTQTTPTGQANPMAPLGGAMMGGSMAAMMGINPLLGAGAGLMLSLFD